MDKNYLLLSDQSEFQEAIFNGDIVITQTYASSNNSGIHDFIKNTNTKNSSFSTDFNLGFPLNNYMMLNNAYLKFELSVTTSSIANTGTVETYFIPNFITYLINSIVINTSDFSYSNLNNNSGRSLATLLNINRMRSYSPNQIMLMSLLQDTTFSSSSSTNNTIDLNRGLKISKLYPSSGGVLKDYQTTYYIDLPLELLLPVSDKIKFISGAVQINLNFAYYDNMITNGKPINSFTGTALVDKLASITDLSTKTITLHYPAIRSFNDNFVNNNSIQKLSGISIQRYVMGTVLSSAISNINKGKLIATMNSSGAIPSNGKALQMIIIPRIVSCKPNGSNVANIPMGNPNGCDDSIAANICADNTTGQNQNYILNGLMYISDVVVKSDSGVVYPSNRSQMLTASSFSDSFNFLNSFVQIQGMNPSGQDSNSCLTFNQYKNYFKAIVVDLTNATSNNVKNNNMNFTVNYNINAINDFYINDTDGTASAVDYVFDSEIYIISMNII